MTAWRIAGRVLEFPPPLAAGIVNVTDDSFFEGARSGTPERAVADGLALAEAGFDLLDVGAVPARSGPAVQADEEAARLVPAIEGLVGRAGVPVTADTFQVEVARRALDAGAAAINDISGGADPEMLDLVAERGCGYVLMHIEGPPRVDREPAGLRRSSRPPQALVRRADRGGASRAAWPRSRSRSTRGSTSTSRSTTTSRSCAASASCASSAGRCSSPSRARTSSARSWPAPGRIGPPPRDREWATAAATALAVAGGAEILRLHDRSALDALRTAAAIAGGRGRRPADAVPTANG